EAGFFEEAAADEVVETVCSQRRQGALDGDGKVALRRGEADLEALGRLGLHLWSIRAQERAVARADVGRRGGGIAAAQREKQDEQSDSPHLRPSFGFPFGPLIRASSTLSK